MASCLAPDFPAVMVALEHLKELDKQLKKDRLPFAPETCLHLTEMTAAITELEADRRTAHEHLEVESIENAKLRHQINNKCEKMSQEIMADVAAARAANVVEIEELQKDLSTRSQIREATVKRRDALLSQNKALDHERQQVKAEHEKLIAALNHQINLKYSMQMQLDQAREQMEELRSCIAAAEQDKIALALKIKQEMEAFNLKKDKLYEELCQTEVKIQDQKQTIKMSREEVQKLNNKKQGTQDHLEELMIEMSRQESNIQRLTASRCQFEKQVARDSRNYQEMRQQRQTLKKQLGDIIQHLQEETTTVKSKIEKGQAARLLLVERLARIYEIYKRQHDEENEVRVEHCHVSQKLMQSKLHLEESIASIVKHSKEIKEMDKQIGNLEEAEVINKRVFHNNQEELCSNIDTEKNNIIHYEGEKNRLRGFLEEAKRKQEEHVAKMSSAISSARRRYEELLREETAFEERQPKSTDPDWLMRHAAQHEVMYRQIESQQHQEMEQCTAKIEIISRSSQEKQKEVEEKEEMLTEVEHEINEKQTLYQRLVVLTSELKSRRSELDLSIQGLKEETSNLLQPKEEMKAELEALRTSHMDVLNKQALELRDVEMGIYDNSVKLELVDMENSRLHLRIRQMTEEVGRAKQDKDRYWQEIHIFREDIKALLESLHEAWKQDLLLTEECQSRDGGVLVSIGALLSHLKTRRQQLGCVSLLLHKQMLDFSKRLGDKTIIYQHR